MNTDTNQFEKIKSLAREGKVAELQPLLKVAIEDTLSQPIKKEEKGKLLVDLASIYMEVSNQIDQKYLEMLERAIASLRMINTREVAASDKIGLKEVRQSLSEDSSSNA